MMEQTSLEHIAIALCNTYGLERSTRYYTRATNALHFEGVYSTHSTFELLLSYMRGSSPGDRHPLMEEEMLVIKRDVMIGKEIGFETFACIDPLRPAGYFLYECDHPDLYVETFNFERSSNDASVIPPANFIKELKHARDRWVHIEDLPQSLPSVQRFPIHSEIVPTAAIADFFANRFLELGRKTIQESKHYHA